MQAHMFVVPSRFGNPVSATFGTRPIPPVRGPAVSTAYGQCRLDGPPDDISDGYGGFRGWRGMVFDNSAFPHKPRGTVPRSTSHPATATTRIIDESRAPTVRHPRRAGNQHPHKAEHRSSPVGCAGPQPTARQACELTSAAIQRSSDDSPVLCCQAGTPPPFTVSLMSASPVRPLAAGQTRVRIHGTDEVVNAANGGCGCGYHNSPATRSTRAT